MTTSSALSAAESAFRLLTCQPSPLAFDAYPIDGLPDRVLPLGELRELLLRRPPAGGTVDVMWRQLARMAREAGPHWVVGAVGVALPALTGMAARIGRGRPRHAEDIASEVLTGFLQALRTAPLDPPRLWLRLCWAAWRAGVRTAAEDPLDALTTEDLPPDLPTGPRSPDRPYGHPDLLLGRAAALGLITAEQAELIGATRFGGVLVEQLAAEAGVSAPVLRMRRRRAERVVVAALDRGDLSLSTRSAA
jgi:DNA-directed RNA polymerase specialized sigma24 family protein